MRRPSVGDRGKKPSGYSWKETSDAMMRDGWLSRVMKQPVNKSNCGRLHSFEAHKLHLCRHHHHHPRHIQHHHLANL
ncbi:unnamed protein product [Protopolystoma xenopodis]|uniref:Uncharacterized protein n=1 Tax=Protopolystoma xenopodis TaxID=117903 RepID=A0A448X2J1_9PLAT|nr:unnamed protein product [Protopolystoma xenopodis]